MLMNKIALITGATSGIGEATAYELAKHGIHLILTGRRQERLNKLKTALQTEFGIKIETLCFDIRKNAEVVDAIEGLSPEWKKIDILVNNAGLAAGIDPIQTASLDDWDQMIDTNIKGLLYITHQVVPLMVKRKQGHIINLSSVAGKEVYENGSVYCGTKHAVEAISKAMRLDLLEHNIKVGTISPGMVETEFSIVRFHGDKGKANQVYEGLTPLYAQDIAEAIYFMVSRPAHVCIDDIFITPSAQGFSRKAIRK